MNQNPVIRYFRVGDLLKGSRLLAVFSVLLYGAVIVAAVYAALFKMASEMTRYGTVICDGIPVVAEKMSLEKGQQEGYFLIESLIDKTERNYEQEEQ